MVEFEVANKRITQMTGARFGAAYQALAEEGTTVMDSLDAATALAVLRAQDSERAIHWVHELQQAFYVNGRGGLPGNCCCQWPGRRCCATPFS